MSDPTISYLKSNKTGLVENYAEIVRSETRFFPSYSKFDPNALYQVLDSALDQHIRAVESGDFEEVKDSIYRIFSNRLRSGFHPNELIRMTNLTTKLVTQMIEHARGEESAKRALYSQRSESIAQVAKMYTAMLNLSIPKEERSEIDSTLLIN